MSVEEALRALGRGDVDGVRNIQGHFALIEKDGQLVRMARSLGRPCVTFLPSGVRAVFGCCRANDEILAFLKPRD